jgi:hypothetical protein
MVADEGDDGRLGNYLDPVDKARFHVTAFATTIPATKMINTDIVDTALANPEYVGPVASNATRTMRSRCQDPLNLLAWPPRPLPDT